MACHQGDLLYGEAGFEQPTGAFVTQIVKTQIVDVDSVA
jgi:hypothetical protein